MKSEWKLTGMLATVLLAVCVGCSSQEIAEYDFVCKTVKCRFTWTGPSTGWRFRSANADGSFTDEGAVQKLSAFMGEKAPSVNKPFTFVQKEGERICKAPDGTMVTIDPDGSFKIVSSAGKVVTEVCGLTLEGSQIRISGRLLDEEPVYGGGGRLDRLNQRGRKMDLWISDGYNDSAACYLAIPFFVTHRGGGVFFNHYERMSADFGAIETNVWSMEMRRSSLDIYFYAKNTIPAAIEAQVSLSGRPAVPPEWSRGPLICRYNPDFKVFEGRVAGEVHGKMLIGYGVKDIVEKHLSMGSKPTAVILEPGRFIDLYTPGGNCGSGEGRRAELEKIVRYLREKNIKAMVYMALGMPFSKDHSGFRPDYVVQASILTNGVMMEAQTDRIPWVLGQKANIDFGAKRVFRYQYLDITNPAMWDWFLGLWKELADIGVNGIKIDFCEELPDDGVDHGNVRVNYRWHNPSVFDGTSVHHAYPTFFTAKLYREMSEYTKDKGGFTIIYRGGHAGSQRSPFHWAGDQVRSFAKLDDHVISMLTLGMSGLPFSTYDMAGYHYDGGYDAVPAGEKIDGVEVNLRKPRRETFENECAVFRRGTEFTAFTPCVQTHGDVRHVYEMDAKTQAHYRKYMRIREALAAYISKLNVCAAKTGAPPVRPLVWRWPDDPRTWNAVDEFMLGDALLVAPVYAAEDKRSEIYLPKGDWEKIEGLELPVYVDRQQPEAKEILNAIRTAMRAEER